MLVVDATFLLPLFMLIVDSSQIFVYARTAIHAGRRRHPKFSQSHKSWGYHNRFFMFADAFYCTCFRWTGEIESLNLLRKVLETDWEGASFPWSDSKHPVTILQRPLCASWTPPPPELAREQPELHCEQSPRQGGVPCEGAVVSHQTVGRRWLMAGRIIVRVGGFRVGFRVAFRVVGLRGHALHSPGGKSKSTWGASGRISAVTATLRLGGSRSRSC